MVTQPWLQWVLTLAFAGALVVMLGLVRADAHRLHRVSHALHALMAVGMLLMTWPATSTLLTTTQLVVFALASAWFVGLLALRLRGRAPREAGTVWALALHAVMMGSMVWMLVAMGRMSSGGGDAMADMPGMTGMSHGGSDAATGLSAGSETIGLALAALLCVGVVTSLVGAARRTTNRDEARRTLAGSLSPGLAMAVMCAGMVVMTATML